MKADTAVRDSGSGGADDGIGTQRPVNGGDGVTELFPVTDGVAVG